jgi:hypothetical protein
MMSENKSIGWFVLLIAFFVVVLITAGCQKTQSVESIYGLWRTHTRFFLFNEDGTWAVAYTRGQIESNPFDWGTYTFDGKKLTFSTDSEAESCPGLTGTWKVTFPNESDIVFKVVDEQCAHRENDIGRNKYTRYVP